MFKQFLKNLAASLLAFLAAPALAGTTTGLPWESPMQTVANSLTGPTAMYMSLVGIAVAGGMLIWGGELGDFARRMLMLVLVIALLVGATSVLSTLFGASGAVIP